MRKVFALLVLTGLSTIAVAQSATAEQWNAFVPIFTTQYNVSTFTPEVAITVSRIQVQALNAPSKCKVNAVLQISDGTVAGTLLITGGANDSGVLTLFYKAGIPITLSVSTPAQCSIFGAPSLANVSIQYHSANVVLD